MAQVRVLPALHIHLHAIHGCLSLTRPSPLSTSQPSSCLSSFSPSSTSATSSSRSSTRRSWKTCATPPTTGVRAPTTSSTSPQPTKLVHTALRSVPGRTVGDPAGEYEAHMNIDRVAQHDLLCESETGPMVASWGQPPCWLICGNSCEKVEPERKRKRWHPTAAVAAAAATFRQRLSCCRDRNDTFPCNTKAKIMTLAQSTEINAFSHSMDFHRWRCSATHRKSVSTLE